MMADQLMLTLKDRLILANQYRILEALYPKEASRFAQQRKAVESGFTSQYDSLLTAIRADVPMADCRLVGEILNLYRALNQSFAQLRDRDGLRSEDIQFPGFDTQSEGPMAELARYLVETMDRSSAFRHSYFESLKPMSERYRRMILAWAGLDHRSALSKQEMQAILAA